MGVKKQISFLAALYHLEFKSALEYRFNFIMQTIGMVLNDACWIFFWYIFFQRFSSVKGWTFQSMVLLFALITIAYGLASSFLGNWKRLSVLIEKGSLDYYLALPKEVLSHLLVKLRYGGTGDALFGIILAGFVLKINQVPLFLAFIFSSTLVLIGWAILFGSLAFYLERAEMAASLANNSLVLISSYPFSVYSGGAKFILLFIIPAGFVAGIPVELLTTFSWKWFFITMSYSIVFLAFSIFIFYRGLKRYESGNTLQMRG